jgi:hypothetical protein
MVAGDCYKQVSSVQTSEPGIAIRAVTNASCG